MSSTILDLHSWGRILLLLLLLEVRAFGLNTDGLLLLSFKSSVLSDPLSVLQTWNFSDQTPCSWNGVTCSFSRVIGLSLSNSQLLGSISSDLGRIQHIRNLNLSNNSLNGSLPESIFNASELRVLDFSNNLISGELSETVGSLKDLELINLSDNALAGKLPANLAVLLNLTVVSLKNNYFSGNLPGRFEFVQLLDLSSNLINGSLPSDLGGYNLRYLNISYNQISGKIPPEFAEKIPGNATIDLSFNNLTGKIPDFTVFTNQESKSFSGNPDLCGEPTKNPCPNLSPSTSPPAFAAIPKTIDSNPDSTPPVSPTEKQRSHRRRLRPAAIVGIVVGDIVGIGILSFIFLYAYKLKKKNNNKNTTQKETNSWSSSSSESRGFTRWSCLLKKADNEESSDSDSDQKGHHNQRQEEQDQSKAGTLVTVDGEKELELETLLKASAYILGATGSSIVYKAVLEDGTALAVRRIGESGVDRFREFESQVRIIAKLVHPNLVRVRGFYWSADEKLVIYDFVPNGSLANARYRKVGSSPCHIPWEVRLKITKGVARGLAHLHEKKHVHGNLKPGNILLGSDMEPKIGDFGLERLATADTSYKAGGSAHNFGSKRSMSGSRDSIHDLAFGSSPSPSPSSIGCISPYQAPESLRSLKPNPKWDVYSFGIILLELLTGKVVVLDELGQSIGLLGEEKARVLRMTDVAIRADVEGKEEALLACFMLGLSCVSMVPQKRPTMKEVLQVLEKIPSSY